MPGVDSTGFVQKTISEIKASIEAGYRQVYGAAVNVATSSRVGQRIGLFAGALAEVWELGEALFNAMDPDAATGGGLDNQLKMVGLSRKPATYSTVGLILIGTNATVVAAGKRGKVSSTAAKFALDSPATIATLTTHTDDFDYFVGDLVTSSGNVYLCVIEGHSVLVDISGTGTAISDGGATWRYLGPGTAAVRAPATATVTGPVQGYAFTVDTIDTPVSGWTVVTNDLDAQTGQNQETDAQARARRDLSLAKAATTPLQAVRTAILEVAGVTSCTIFENYTDATVDGIPSKAFECLVEGGADQDIRDAILTHRPGGIQAYGTTSGSATDSEGGTHTIAFSRPSAVNIYVKVTLAVDSTAYPADGDTQVKDSVVARGNARPVGRDVVASNISAPLLPPSSDVPGVFDVSQVLIGTVNPPVSSATISISPRQRAVFDTSRVTVVSAPGSF